MTVAVSTGIDQLAAGPQWHFTVHTNLAACRYFADVWVPAFQLQFSGKNIHKYLLYTRVLQFQSWGGSMQPSQTHLIQLKSQLSGLVGV